MEYMIDLINLVLLAFLMVIAVAIVWLRNLFAVVMLTGIYSLVMAAVFVILDAVDVAFTEAAIGAGISVILMLGALALTGREFAMRGGPHPGAFAIVVGTFVLLAWGTLDMPFFGDPLAPAQVHVVPRYLEETPTAMGIPNVVTAVLASYRGYDTLGELFVIFTAGVGALALLGVRRPKKEED